MSDIGKRLSEMAEEVTGFMLAAVEDVGKGKIDWAQVNLDEAAEALGKMQELVEENGDG